MIKCILYISLSLLLLLSTCGCVAPQTDSFKSQPNTEAEALDGYYIIPTDYMTFYFSINDFDANEISKIKDEAVRIMREIRDYLNVSYNTFPTSDSVCYFDSSYVGQDGLSRSYCFPDENVMYCITPYDFIHEYVHMVMGNITQLVYHPSDILREGFAQYISLNFFNNISTTTYGFFKAPPVPENSNAAEHTQICKLIEDNYLEYNAKNYLKAFVFLYSQNYDISTLNTSGDFYNYYVGYVFTDYCINELGGLNRFISAYCDSVMIKDTYGKTLSEIINDACDDNEKTFK